jgi:hypothetical protein
MHETVHIEDRVMMREAERFMVPPHQRLRFGPGGNHLMLLHTANALAAGDTTGIVLRFADGRTLHATAKVRS